MGQLARIWKTSAVVIALVAATAACGESDSTRTRNAVSAAGTDCTKPGQVSKISKVSVVCANTDAGNIWYATTSARGKAIACTTPGALRKKKAVVWVCGVTKGKKQWRATAPLPPKVLEATAVSLPALQTLIPTLEPTEVATPAQPVVADNNVLADPKIADEIPEPTVSTPAATTPVATIPTITTPFVPVSTIKWATTGTNPYGIAIDASGNVYTANIQSNNVTKITPTGESTILGTTGGSPYGIAIDASGNIYTANSGSNTVSKITTR